MQMVNIPFLGFVSKIRLVLTVCCISFPNIWNSGPASKEGSSLYLVDMIHGLNAVNLNFVLSLWFGLTLTLSPRVVFSLE